MHPRPNEIVQLAYEAEDLMEDIPHRGLELYEQVLMKLSRCGLRPKPLQYGERPKQVFLETALALERYEDPTRHSGRLMHVISIYRLFAEYPQHKLLEDPTLFNHTKRNRFLTTITPFLLYWTVARYLGDKWVRLDELVTASVDPQVHSCFAAYLLYNNPEFTKFARNFIPSLPTFGYPQPELRRDKDFWSVSGPCLYVYIRKKNDVMLHVKLQPTGRVSDWLVINKNYQYFEVQRLARFVAALEHRSREDIDTIAAYLSVQIANKLNGRKEFLQEEEHLQL